MNSRNPSGVCQSPSGVLPEYVEECKVLLAMLIFIWCKSLFLNILPRKIQGIVYQTHTLHFMWHHQNRVQFFIGHNILISCESNLPNNLSTPAWSSNRVGFPGSIPGHAVLMAFSILLSNFT